MKLVVIMCLLLLSSQHAFSQERSTTVAIDSAGIRKVGVLGESGKILVPLMFEFVSKDRDYFFVRQHGLWGCYTNGRMIIPAQYDAIGFRMPEDLIVKAMKGEKWGFVDINNQTIVDFMYDEACNFLSGKAYVKKGTVYGHVNKKGEMIDRKKEASPFCSEDISEASEITDQFEDGLLMIKQVNHLYGVVEKGTEKVIVPFSFDEIGGYSNHFIKVRSGKKWGVYSDQGRKIADPVYDQVGYFE